ncbi:TonB-dependent receptor [Mucilaginibacter sp.]|uniref:TonB-dependent receptor n=1 Tax=Mucilaginibacter sp. TaxID=1882438 RepID=UPI003B003D47
MRKHLLLLFFSLFAVNFAFAQVTTSSLNGVIKDSKGVALIGATIQATHLPSGTRYGTATNADGRYAIPNMRVGGPYSVTISYIGYQAKTENDIVLTLGQNYVLNSVLQSSTELKEVTVVATTSRLLNSSHEGSTTNISSRDIGNLPTIGRNINELSRLTPQATSTSNGAIGGGNYRQNNITVDGSNFNNQFGIGSNLPANGAPISIDALEEISVNVSPFDVKQSGFIGSALNAVTKSGTNEFRGTAYTFFRNQSLQGNLVNRSSFVKQATQQNTYGFAIGGPIIKNKLFFFGNFETYKNEYPGQQFTASTPDNPYSATSTTVKRPMASVLDGYRQTLISKYGYDPGAYQGYGFKSTNTKFLGKLDWNINDNNHFNVRYSQVESRTPSFVSTSRSPLPSFTQTRTSQYALQFANSNYYQDQNLYSLSAELNSSFNLFNTKLANTLRGTFDHQNDPRSSDSQVFPFVDILNNTTSVTPGGTYPYTSFGYEPFTYGNLRDVRTYSFYDYLNWTTGIHSWTVGGQAEFSKIKNGFQRFGTGYYTFDSWDSFIGGKNPTDYAITYPINSDYHQVFPSFKFAQYSVYGQDDITFSDKFRISPGIRFDLPTYPGVDEIRTHPLVAALNFNGTTINTGELPKTRIMVSPRIGFNYDIFGDRSLQIRGGTGIFTGTIPYVWIVAQSGDSGLLQFTKTYSGVNSTPGPFNPDPRAYLPATPPAAGTTIPSTISVMDPNLKFPQAWKSTLAVDGKLPFGIVGTLEGIYNKDINPVRGINPNLVNPSNLNVAGYPDSRLVYPATNSTKFIYPLTSAGLAVPTGTTTGTQAFNPVILTNGKGGYYYSITARLQKTFQKGFSGSIAYIHSEAKNLFDGSGDQLLNTWTTNYVSGNANNPGLSTASYVVPDRIVANFSYRREYLKHLATTLSLFYEGSIDGRYTYYYGADFNRDGQTNDLIYIPKNPSEITFVSNTINGITYTPQQQSDAFFAYIAQDKYLSKHMGEYTTRNGATYPWRSQFDFKFIQQLFTNVGGKRNTLEFTWDVFNIGNFLNNRWGVHKLVNASAILTPTNTTALVAGGTVKPTFRLAADRGALVSSTFRDDVTLNSTYYMQFGLRYRFN